MPNLDNLMDMIAEHVEQGPGETFFTTLDMTYAYGQVELSEETSKHCNFQIIGGKATGIYRFITGFYGLTTMPTEFQRIIDLTLAGITNTFAFIDDILIVTHGTEEEHITKVKEVLKRLDDANINLKLDKCTFAAKNIEWVGYNLSQKGVAPINSKVQGISERLRPTNLKQLRSFLGAVNQFNKFILDLAKLCFPFRTLLKRDNEWNWKEEQERAFVTVNEAIKKATTLNHFKRNCPLRLICDASKSGLGAVLQQQEEGTWKPISFASRFLTKLESKYSINELELLAIVWSIEYFRSYVYGVPFKIISDHKALATVLKGQKANKTYSSRLTRWLDRLLPYEFEVIHGPGRTLGIADYLSRNPSQLIENSIKSNTLWDEWFTVNIVSELKNLILANEKPSRGGRQPIKSEKDAIEKESSEGANDATPRTIKQTIRDVFIEQQLEMARKRDASETRKLHELAIKPPVKRPITLALIDKNSNTPLKSSIQRIGENMLAATYDCDPLLQSIITLLQKFDQKKFNKLPKVWQQRYNELRLDENNFIYIDERLVIPEELRRPIFRSLHWGHPGRDTMLRAVADIWWPRIHREIVLLAQSCSQCQKAGKNLKTVQKQSEYGKLPAAETHNDEIAIDFAGPFKIAPKAKKYLIVTIDHKTNWPNAAFVRKPTAETVVNFLNAHIAQFGIPKRIRTDPATIFRGGTFKQFCNDHFIKHIECPVRDHRGNGKIERLIRTLNERLRADKTIVTEKGNTGLARLLFALRTAATINKDSPFELVFGRKPNTIKEIITEIPKTCLETEDALQLTPEDFPKDDDSTIFLRDKTKNTKLEGQFKKRHGSIVAESSHTITLENERGRQVIAKRDIAKQRSMSHNPKTKTQKTKGGNSHSLERKIAALKNAEEREEMELNKPLKTFIKKKEDKNTTPKTKSPRKQAKPKKSLAGLPERNNPPETTEQIESSSDEEEEQTLWQETAIKQNTGTTEEKQSPPDTRSNVSRQSQRTKRKPNWFGQNVMVTKVDEKDSEDKNAAQTDRDIERELEEIPNFEEMTQEEIDYWVNN